MHPALFWQERQSTSPFIESVWTCSTRHAVLRPVIADPCITIALVKAGNISRVIMFGPKTAPYQMRLAAGYSCIALRLKPGVSLKYFPTAKLIDDKIVLPVENQSHFLFGGTALQFPDFNNAEQLTEALHERGLLDYVELDNEKSSSRTYSRRVRRITGLSPYRLYQLQRMHQALRLLKQGVRATEVATELEFVDQPHLIHATKHFLGHTPKHLPLLPQNPQ